MGRIRGKKRSRICRKASDYIQANPDPQADPESASGWRAFQMGEAGWFARETRCNDCRKPVHMVLGEPASDHAPLVVLDTNVVLDWLVFREEGCAPLALAIECGKVRWRASPWMRAELAHVLRRGLGPRWTTDPVTVDGCWVRWAEEVAAPDVMAPATRLHCSDPQDQPFIDLALTVGARWLVSRDKALLCLARRASRHGLDVLTPERWARAVGIA